jgi:hypothetical protein
VTDKIWLTIGALLVVVMGPTFWLGRLWERDSGPLPRGDHAFGPQAPFSPPRPGWVERARSANLAARYDRLMGIGDGGETPGNPRQGRTVNQFWEDIEQEARRGAVDKLPDPSGPE